MKQFKIRSSAIGNIMADTKSITDKQIAEMEKLIEKRVIKPLTALQEIKLSELITKKNTPPELSAGTKEYLQTWYLETRFGRRKEFSSKYTEKGNKVEDANIEFYSRMSGRDFLKKNEKHFENEFITGTPDVIADIIIDVKSSWDLFSFPTFDFGDEIKNKLYWWQLQGYMDLTGKDEAELFYGLVDAPPEMILKEMNKRKWCIEGVPTPEEDAKLEAEVERDMTFGDIPERIRCKTFTVKKDPVAIQRIHDRVLLCREYVEGLHIKLEQSLYK